ncbi:IucA/IucC family protein [Staphylospora marina]|uniref:IucA/IucC family protein n=1 Tax=Staphylospora marina TaxID=2490858 RepID=UPI0013DDAEE3|nr:IucA/IucC family protein [Staphylospora marina]
MRRQWRRIAERQTLERLLNTYLREKGDGLCTEETLDASAGKSGRFTILLPRQHKRIHGTFAHFSPFGHHRYEDAFAVSGEGEESVPAESWKQVAVLLLDEIRDESEEKQRDALLHQMENSIDKTAVYLGRADEKKDEDWMMLPDGERSRRAEQRLLFGHPFHPTPKSSEGFGPEDLEQYAPEMEASFPLVWVAVHPEWIREERVDGENPADEAMFPADVREEAALLLAKGYRLFPIHPWQAGYLERDAVFQKALEHGAIVRLKQGGPLVSPTSSVRTVFSPELPWSLKLPLHVRITHFVRENTPEQIRRSLDASRVIRKFRRQWPCPSLTVLTETGALQICPPDARDREVFPAASANVLFRENPDRNRHAPLVVAALLECAPGRSEPPLFSAIREALNLPDGPVFAEGLAKWLEAYVEVAVIPAIELFAETGISLEAHVQNSLIHLENGWPTHFYVRDMEGVSINREHPEIRKITGGVIPVNSPVLYEERTAWERLQYYLITNHLGHLIHVLAYYGGWEESAAWMAVRERLERHLSRTPSHRSGWFDRLLTEETLAAKANLVSRLQNRSDNAVYIRVPNLLKRER